MSHPNAELLERFYTAFSTRDHAVMGLCYADDVAFSDPVFPELAGWRARAMWQMLCERGADLTLEFSGIEADDSAGKAHWEARYTFSGTGRKVHNMIDAEFTFRDGKIVEHTDTFDFHRWAGMALGPMGSLLGWTPFLRNKVRGQAASGLDGFIDKRGLGPA